MFVKKKGMLNMKIVNTKKFIRSLTLIFLIGLILPFIIIKTSFSYTKTEYKTLYVKSGDTLWSIANNLQSTNYYKGKDIRFIIEDIKEINSLSNSNIEVDQELKIPTA